MIREHYPIERLPEDLRRDLPSRGRVSVEIVVEAPTGEVRAEQGHFGRFRDRRHPDFRSAEAIDAHISALRDEWERPT
ncbi:hypothetical protein [Pinisolibacter sp.]|uniref:hypothetical protein n=1 Tax=Pinisolibacter sp. TaxID=2172024 RepID=UPI002FDC972B